MWLHEAEQAAVDGARMIVVVVGNGAMLGTDPVKDAMVPTAMRSEYDK